MLTKSTNNCVCFRVIFDLHVGVRDKKYKRQKLKHDLKNICYLMYLSGTWKYSKNPFSQNNIFISDINKSLYNLSIMMSILTIIMKNTY